MNSHIFGRAIAYTQPDDLWWRPPQYAEPVKIFILRDKGALKLLCQPPHRRVRGPACAEFSHVNRIRQNVR